MSGTNSNLGGWQSNMCKPEMSQANHTCRRYSYLIFVPLHSYKFFGDFPMISNVSVFQILWMESAWQTESTVQMKSHCSSLRRGFADHSLPSSRASHLPKFRVEGRRHTNRLNPLESSSLEVERGNECTMNTHETWECRVWQQGEVWWPCVQYLSHIILISTYIPHAVWHSKVGKSTNTCSPNYSLKNQVAHSLFIIQKGQNSWV